MDELRRRAQTLLDYPPIARTPIGELRRRAKRRRVRRALTTGAVVIGCAAAAAGFAVSTHATPPDRVAVLPTTASATTSTTLPLPAVGAPTRFVSIRGGPNDDGHIFLEVSDARTGAILDELWRVPDDGSYVTGTAIASNGQIWVTLNKGPRLRSDVASGDPQPNSCSSLLVQIDPRTGAVHTLLHGGRNELIEDIQPSPTGDRIAYDHSGCLPTSKSSLRIKDLATGHVDTIDTAFPECPTFDGNPRWTPDGNAIVFLCGGRDVEQVSVVPVRSSQSEFHAKTTKTDSGCVVDALAVTRDGYAAVEHCGVLFISGPSRLVRYNRALQPVSCELIGQCENGDSIAGNPRTQAVMLSTYLFCSPPATEPDIAVFSDSGHGLHRMLSLEGGYLRVADISF